VILKIPEIIKKIPVRIIVKIKEELTFASTIRSDKDLGY
jgi:hypothetical protein|tara:strand:- start:210 stop:326 length:117 start_codon:yes stop_codon:yes gene_type:complete